MQNTWWRKKNKIMIDDIEFVSANFQKDTILEADLKRVKEIGALKNRVSIKEKQKKEVILNKLARLRDAKVAILSQEKANCEKIFDEMGNEILKNICYYVTHFKIKTFGAGGTLEKLAINEIKID